LKPYNGLYNSALALDKEIKWIDLGGDSKESNEETKVAGFLSCMAL